jgi:hypothetical protein
MAMANTPKSYQSLERLLVAIHTFRIGGYWCWRRGFYGGRHIAEEELLEEEQL